MSGSPKHRRKDKATFQRYVRDDHRTENKTRRIRKNNGEAFLALWQKTRSRKAHHSADVK